MRAWQKEDAAQLKPILEANRAHLGPWIPARVAEPAELPALETRLEGFADDFAHDRSWRFAVLSLDGAEIYGEVDLLPRTSEKRVPYDEADRIEIGYWLRSDLTGRGFATEAAQAVMEVAIALPRVSCIEIRCDARNAASASVPRRLGFVLTETLDESGVLPDEPSVEVQVWTYAVRSLTSALVDDEAVS